MEIPDELEIVQKKISRLLSDPFCKTLSENSFFTEIQLEAILIDYLTYQTLDPKVTQTYKAQARQLSAGRSRGSYNRVLRQSKNKLKKTIYSMLLLGYLGILGDARSARLMEISQRMREYLELRADMESESASTLHNEKTADRAFQAEILLKKQLFAILTGSESPPL